MTVMNARAMKAKPMVGTTPVTGAMSAPAAPARAAPKAKVIMWLRAAWTPRAAAISGSCVAARASRPYGVCLKTT
jgi:hypothetical protein